MGTVLVVDDDAGLLETVRIAFTRSRHDVTEAACVAEGLRHLARDNPFDLALVDIRLPDGNGLELLRAIRRSTPMSRVVIMTGFATVRDSVTALRLGAADYLEKPVDIDVLLGAMPTSNEGIGLAGSQSAMHRRWSQCVVAVASSAKDLPTIDAWAKHVGISAGSLRNICWMVGLGCKDSLNLGRMIRIVLRRRPDVDLSNLLTIVDRRTLHRFLRLGAAQDSPGTPQTMEELLTTQCWIKDSTALSELRSTLQGYSWNAGPTT